MLLCSLFVFALPLRVGANINDTDEYNIRLMRQLIAEALYLEFGIDDYNEFIAKHGEDAFFAFVNRDFLARNNERLNEIRLLQEQLSPCFDSLWDDLPACPLENCNGTTKQVELSTGWRQCADTEGWVMCQRDPSRNSRRQTRTVTPYIICSNCSWQIRGTCEQQTRTICATAGENCP